MMDDDEWIAQELDKHAFGIGARGYFDYVVSKMFFVNLYSEFIKYFARDQEMLAFTRRDLWSPKPRSATATSSPSRPSPTSRRRSRRA